MSDRIKQLVDQLNLLPHPEGGFFRETYRSSGTIKPDLLPESIDTNRNYSTSIYFLLTSENFSAFHRIKSDEIWHFYEGSTVQLHQISPIGIYSTVLIGSDLENKNHFQYVVPAQFWFAAEVIETNSYSLVGCTVSPGFDFADFELANRNEMIRRFPQHQQIIQKFTRD